MTTGDPITDRRLEASQLPEGVSVADWEAEKSRGQNPRIRTLLGCSGMLEAVHESNQAILNCSPDRLAEIWAMVRHVALVIEEDLLPLLEETSLIPALEGARQRTRSAALVLSTTIVAEIVEMPIEIEQERSRDFRKLLCVALGQLDDFLQDAFAELMANDPRSLHDAGYFLSLRFRRDVEEAAWLIASVDDLDGRLDAYEERRQRLVRGLVERLESSDTLPETDELGSAAELLREIVHDLTRRLKEVAALRGIRFAELEVIDHWALDLPAYCHGLLELWQVTRSGRAEGRAGAASWEGAVRARSLELLRALDDLLQDLRAFLPLWRRGISDRRALAFRRDDADSEDA